MFSFHTPTKDQAEVLDALKYGHFKAVKPTTLSARSYITKSGLFFQWYDGLGDGKDVWILEIKQPEWFAKRVRKLLSR